MAVSPAGGPISGGRVTEPESVEERLARVEAELALVKAALLGAAGGFANAAGLDMSLN